mgnify:CR=1 FL=1
MGLTSVENEKELNLYLSPNLISTFKQSYLGKRVRVKDDTETESDEDLEDNAPKKRQNIYINK